MYDSTSKLKGSRNNEQRVASYIVWKSEKKISCRRKITLNDPCIVCNKKAG